jgi:CheY-like chemotaxis protein
VEDNKADVFLIREVIEAAEVPADFHIVHDGQDAKLFLDAADPCPDLVLLDLNLPKTNGEEVLKHLRSATSCRDTPVLVVTSSDSARDRDKVAQLGITAYFRKPSAYSEFLKLGPLVKSVLTQSA